MINTTVKVPPRQQLTAERTRRGWTQLEVVDQLGTTPGNVSRWERGITSPSPYFRCKLSELFGMSAQELGLVWDASEALLTQVQIPVGSSTAVALTQAQANHERGGIGNAQMAIESAFRHCDDDTVVLWVKANTPEVGDEGLVMLMGGLNRPEHRQERPVPAGTPRLHIHPDWVLVLDDVEDVRLIVEVLPSGKQSTLTPR
jgi:transcriptional regulator with XRE-family HTH domain